MIRGGMILAGVLGVLAIVTALAHVWPLLVIGAGVGGFLAGRRRAGMSSVERVQLLAELDGARESAALAWDAAAEQPPRPAREVDELAERRRRLVDDPMSGARPL